MRTLKTTTKLYKFHELSKKAKAVAVEYFRDINVDHDWWDFVYDDAAEVGIKIKGFDVGYRQDIEIELEDGAYDTANMIIEKHGECCDTYKVAKEYLAARHIKNVAMKLIGNSDDNTWSKLADEAEDLDDQFKKDIAREYWKNLRDEYENLQTEEAIIETIECNEYEFYHDGTFYSPAKSKKQTLAA